MNWFSNMSIRHKQMLIIMATSAVALLLACAAFVAYDMMAFRGELVKKTSIVAEVIGNNCAAAIDFNDPKSAQEALGALRAEPNIISACVYDRNGEPFAVYSRIKPGNFVPPVCQDGGHEFAGRALRLFQPIRSQGEGIGVVFIESDLKELRDRLIRYPGIVVLMFAVSLLAAFIVSSRLHRIISDPILHLAEVARSVAEDKNYSLRATKGGQDEVGQLIEGFNEMLAQIQHRETALRLARDLMEQRVEERTEDLARSLSLLNATIESTADGILAVNLSDKVVSFNNKFVSMWAIPVELLKQGEGAAVAEFLAGQMKHPLAFTALIEKLRAGPEAGVVDVIELKDDRVFERLILPQRIESQRVGYVFSYRDITERRKAEANLEAVHSELVQISRQAGMAEVATNVLHNVGNVLNSVNTSASIVMDQVRAPTISGIARVVALLEEHRHDLARYLSQSGTADRIITFLKTLSHHLETERTNVLGELQELVKNIEHIKEVVAMQQSYAKVSGVMELQSLSGLLEDALRIHAAALAKQQVRIIRQFDPLPDLLVDKHKVLQILVNLISNAKYALAASATERLLTLTVSRNGDEDTVRVSVTDNGMGIGPEYLSRIFAYGFTTRPNGHGFGLHSGALAAREMGGTLSVHSDGPGRGATFTLVLPAQMKKGTP